MSKIAKFILWAGLSLTALSAQARDGVTIGTGGQTGVYYVAGQSICQLVNRHTDFACKAPSTGASLANLDAIAEQSLDMGIVQSDGNIMPITVRMRLPAKPTRNYVRYFPCMRNRSP